jgi:HAD superfamily hydrolase (TIGR01509 family)
MKNIAAAIFDLDGTLIDSNEAWFNAEKTILERNNIFAPDEPLKKMVLLTYEEIYPEMKAFGLPYDFDTFVSTMDSIVMDEYENNITLKDNAVEFLEHLRSKGIKTAIATSSTKRICDMVLDSNGVRDLFDLVLTTADVGVGKENPEIYLRTAQLLNVPPDHCLVFEDRFLGVETAKKEGMKTVAVYDRYSQLDFFKARGYADQYIYSFADMMSERKASLIGDERD